MKGIQTSQFGRIGSTRAGRGFGERKGKGYFFVSERYLCCRRCICVPLSTHSMF